MKHAYRKHLVNVVCIVSRQKIANVLRFPLWVAGVSSVVSRDVMQWKEARDKLAKS